MSQSAGIQLVNMLGARGTQSGQMAQQLQKLEDSCKDFESVFTTKLLEVMRKTVPKDGMINGGRAEEIFTGLMNDEIAKNIADTGQMGLANMMFTQLKQQLFGTGEITDPQFFELGRELIKIDAGSADPAVQDGITELLEGGAGEGAEGVEITDMLAEAGVITQSETASDAASEAVVTDEMIPVTGETAQIEEAVAIPVMQGEEVPQDVQQMPQDVQQLQQDIPVKAEVTPEAVNTVPEQSVPQNASQVDYEMEAGVTADEAEAVDVAVKTQETTARKSDTEAKAAPEALATVADDGEAPVTETVRKDAMDRYRRADGKNEARSFAARVSEHIRSNAPQNVDATAPAAETVEVTVQGDAKQEGTDISLLKSEIDGKVEAGKRLQGFAVPQQQQGAAPKGAGDADKTVAVPVNNETDESAAAFQRMQVLGTAVTETETAEITRATVEEPAKAMNQIIRSAQVMVQEGRSEMTIELQPRHLGEVRINIVMDNDVLTARIHAKNEAVGDMIRLNLGQLGESMKDMGFDVSHFDVSSGSDYGFGRENSGQAGERDGQPVFTDSVSDFLEGMEPELPEPYRYDRPEVGQHAFNAVA